MAAAAGGELVMGSASGRKAEKRVGVAGAGVETGGNAVGGGVRVGEADEVEVVEVVGGGGESVNVVVVERAVALSA